jgi:nicotinamide riboside transporter PnuC
MWAPNPQPAHPFESRANTVLILGVVGLAACQLTGPFAWKLGNEVLRDSKAAGLPEPGANKAGRICGIVATTLLIITFLVMVAGIAVLVIVEAGT